MASIVDGLKANLKEVKNLAGKYDDEVLSKLGQEVVQNYETDKTAMSPWEDQIRDALKLAQQVKEKKSTPWEDAANVKFPLMTVAAIQFAARAYPEIVKANSIVKCKVTGKDPDGRKELKASRISAHMNYQLCDEMTEWESDTDQLLHILPILGMVWRKTYFDPARGRNVSEIVLPTDCYVNNKARTEDTARRITHRYYLYENDIWERQKAGIWRDVDLGTAQATDGLEGDTDIPHEILEQHRYYDLDDDGYAEPYVVTVHKEKSEVLRILPRYDEKGIVTNEKGNLIKIRPTNYFVLYSFIPNPDGSIFSVGFGQMLEPMNETINTLINQLIDAGTMSNTGGGFIGRGIKIRGGQINFRPNEWHFIETQGQDLQKNIFPLPVREPSATLFQLLTFLVQGAKEIASVQDILGGDTKMVANMPATTMMALIEQGLKVYNSIYKRIYRSLSREFRNLFNLNAHFLDKEKYLKVIGEQWRPPKEAKPQEPGIPPSIGGPGMGPGASPGMHPPGDMAGKMPGNIGQPMMSEMVPGGQPGMPGASPPPQTPLAGPVLAMAMGLDFGEDYSADDVDVLPVADPNMSTEMQRMAKIQAVTQFSGRPGINEIELTRQLVKAIHPMDEEKLLLSDKQLTGEEPTVWKPPPNPQSIVAQARAMDVQAKAMEAQVRTKMDMEKFGLEVELLTTQIAKLKADAMLALAKAESEINEDSFHVYKHDVDSMMKEMEIKVAMLKDVANRQQQSQQAQQMQMQMAGGGPQPGIRPQGNPNAIPVK
jgi:hypothetical protein